MKKLFFFWTLLIVGNSFSQELCRCTPWVKPKLQPRGEAKHLTDFNQLINKSDTIDLNYVYGWQKLYSNITQTITINPFKQSSKRKHNTPEDSLYVLKGYMWLVRKEAFDCDYHIEIGTADSKDIRIVVEISQENKLLQLKVRQHLDSLGLFISGCTNSNSGDAHFTKGLPVIITGAGFYDATHKPNTHHGDYHTKKYSWELHPVINVVFL